MGVGAGSDCGMLQERKEALLRQAQMCYGQGSTALLLRPHCLCMLAE
jgi:hypothetical protein